MRRSKPSYVSPLVFGACPVSGRRRWRGIYAPLPRSGIRPGVYAGFGSRQSLIVPIGPPSRRLWRRDGGPIGRHESCITTNPSLKDGPNTASRKRPLKRPQGEPTEYPLGTPVRQNKRRIHSSQRLRPCGQGGIVGLEQIFDEPRRQPWKLPKLQRISARTAGVKSFSDTPIRLQLVSLAGL